MASTITGMNTGSPTCPGCASPLGPAPVARCPQCRLPLLGADAAALWRVTLTLASLDAQRQSLLLHRDHLLAGLRARQDLPDPPPHAPYVPPTGREVSGPSAQTVLLVLGGLLVGIAALVFTVVSWGRLDLGVKALILAAVTVCALLAPLPLRRRGLTATAETAAALGLSLVLLDWYATRAVGLVALDRIDAAGYWAAATVLTAAGAAAYGAAVRLRGPLPAALLLLQLPCLLAALAIDASPTGLAVACLATALLDLALTARVTAPVYATAQVYAAAGWALLGGLQAGGRLVDAATFADARPSCLPLALLAGLGLAVALSPALPVPLLATEPRTVAAAVAGAALLTGVGGSLRFALPTDWIAAGYAIPGALLALACVLALTAAQPRHDSAWLGLLCLAGATLVLAQLSCLPALVTAYFGPAARWGSTWFGWDATHAAWALAPVPFALPWLLVAVLGAAAARCARTGRRPAARQLSGAALAIAAPVVLLLPAVLQLPLRAGAAWAVLLAAGATAALVRRPDGPAAALVLVAPSTVAAVLRAGADRPTTIAVWSVLAVLAALLAATLPVRWASAPAVAAVLALAVVAVTAGTTAGLAPHQYAFAVLAVTALSVPAATRRGGLGLAVELSGYALTPLALVLTAGHPDASSLLLTVAGLLALGVAALRPDSRRLAGPAAAALLILASWVRLVLAEVTAPEPYTVSVAVAALTIGHLRRRREPSAPSWTTYGPGLGTALLPSLLATWTDPHWPRPLLLGAFALALTVFGARRLLRAPLVLGAGTLLLVACHELAPLVVQVLDVLPRWLPLAAAGLLLLVLGATYEQRLRDARRAREGLRRMA